MSGIDRCKWCGVLTDKICSHFNGVDQPVYFCCMQHKKLWLEECNAVTQEVSKEAILPQVRVLIGHKQKDGTITVMPGDGKVPR
jgi:phage terminase large subunit